MSPRALARGFGVYVTVLGLLALALFLRVRLDRTRAPRGPYIVSVWAHGVRVARAVVEQHPEQALADAAAAEGATQVIEQLIDSAPLFRFSSLVFAASIAPARDGVSATLDGHTAYATPSDLLKLEAYEAPSTLGSLQLVLGMDAPKVVAALAAELHVNVADLERRGRFRRFAATNDFVYPKQLPSPDTAAISKAVQGAARYLARNQRRDGTFRYEIDAMTGGDSPDYNFPRHAGATFFLAHAGRQLHDLRLLRAARRAAAYVKDHATLQCGKNLCIGEGEQVDVGAAALTVLTYVELFETGEAPEFREPALSLASFLRSQQRADGDFQHLYSVKEQHPIDVQLEYYTGEAAFALARVARISGDPQDLSAARRALTFLVHRPALFVGARYFWGAEHWTCQVLADLWQRAPDREALDFCLAWQRSNRDYQLSEPLAPAGFDGGISRGPFLTPRLTPLGSRLEAAVATLATARAAGIPKAELADLEQEIRRGFGFLLRFQFNPGPTYLMPDPRAVAGGLPGGVTDLHVRIDYPQHAGGAMLRWLELVDHGA